MERITVDDAVAQRRARLVRHGTPWRTRLSRTRSLNSSSERTMERIVDGEPRSWSQHAAALARSSLSSLSESDGAHHRRRRHFAEPCTAHASRYAVTHQAPSATLAQLLERAIDGSASSTASRAVGGHATPRCSLSSSSEIDGAHHRRLRHCGAPRAARASRYAVVHQDLSIALAQFLERAIDGVHRRPRAAQLVGHGTLRLSRGVRSASPARSMERITVDDAIAQRHGTPWRTRLSSDARPSRWVFERCSRASARSSSSERSMARITVDGATA